ncbi:MAG: hypothetical protein IT385_24340 [Deltaproteobacteria bacterium]|nr:hypothetical protein [Deltaproteobacteria bacterium]
MAAEWFVMVDGVRMGWEQVVFKLSTGAWTLAEAVKHTALSPRALAMRLGLTEAAGGVVGRAAASALVRLGLAKAAAGVAAGGVAAGAGGAGGLGLLGWLGIAGLVIAVGVGGYWVYKRSSAQASSTATQQVVDDRGGDEVCPEPVQHRTACPWTPEGYTVEPCGPGKCWDGGPQGALACKQPETPEYGGRSYTNDVVCGEGRVPKHDPCTGVVLSCDAP